MGDTNTTVIAAIRLYSDAPYSNWVLFTQVCDKQHQSLLKTGQKEHFRSYIEHKVYQKKAIKRVAAIYHTENVQNLEKK